MAYASGDSPTRALNREANAVRDIPATRAGASLLREWGIAVTDGPLVICRRLGALYVGLALMFFLGRTAGPSDLRSAVCLGVGCMSALLAALGLFELWSGRVTSGIVIPAVVETLLAAGFGWAWWVGR